MKKGKTKSSYFKEMGYTSIGDKYQDEYKLQKLDEMQKKSKIPNRPKPHRPRSKELIPISQLNWKNGRF